MNGFSEWIIHGEWNDEVISKEIQLFLKKNKAATPLELLSIMDVLKRICTYLQCDIGDIMEMIPEDENVH